MDKRFESEDSMGTTHSPNRAYHMAVQAVKCPKCQAGFGDECQSTGGGNWTAVPTHKARQDRITNWTDEQRQHFGDLVWRNRRTVRNTPAEPPEVVDQHAAEAEAAATPIPTKTAKHPTPKGVRLSENQAKEIERAACNAGKMTVSTAHFHGDHQHRQTINAIRDKGILAEGPLVNGGWEREYTLTDFGWQVYLNHRLIIRREEADWHAAAHLAQLTNAAREVTA